MNVPSEFGAILQKCATEEWYCQAYEKRSSRPGLRELDWLWQDLRAGRPLQATDLDELLDKTHFGEFWRIPSTLDREGLAKKKISIMKIDCSSDADDKKRWNEWRRRIVKQLFLEFGSLDLTSVLLRCVHPEGFGIYSPPLLCLLQVPIAEPVTHYLAYCDELAVWGRHFLGDKTTIGEADQAIWVFYERVYGPRADLENRQECQKSFKRDPWVRKRHTDSVLKPFFQRFPALKQAEFLIGIDDNLAGKIAGCEFEARLRSLVNEREFNGDLVDLIEYVAEHKHYGPRKHDLHWVRDRRNRALHGEKGIQKGEVEKMIEVTGNLPERNKRKS